jgi:hypothetical protein
MVIKLLKVLIRCGGFLAILRLGSILAHDLKFENKKFVNVYKGIALDGINPYKPLSTKWATWRSCAELQFASTPYN